jgi:predicted regulator of Ras-like GTPase activity (Roadblock/LC7/MglB family)
MDMSVFGVALEAFSKRHAQVKIAILYDALGETIDYYSIHDPFVARLAAAHHGLIFVSTQSRLAWLKLGKVEVVEICATHSDSLTMEIGDEIYLTVVVSHASIDNALSDDLTELASQLRIEAGF